MGRKHGTLVQLVASNAPDETPEALTCGICGGSVDVDEEYLTVQCNTCSGGGFTVHHECGVEFLIARASEKSNSHAAEKYRIKARKRPQEIFSLGVPCPNLAYTIGKQEGHGRQTVGSKDFKGAKAATGACSGFTTGAELVKPAKAAPAPLPQEALPAPRGPKKAKAAGAKAPAPPPAKRAGSAASSASGVRLVGDKHAGWSTVGQPKGAGAAARIFGSKGPPAGGGVPGAARAAQGSGAPSVIPPGVPRPVELQMCQDLLDCGECFTYQCPRAHGEAELRQREREWAAQQEARKREAVRRQAQAAAAAQAKLEAEQALQAQIASLETLSREGLGQPSAGAPHAWGVPAPSHAPPAATEPAMGLTDASLAMMRTFKKQMCLNSILDLGFPVQQAQAATDAAAGDAERAAQLLLDGLPLSGAPPIDLSREVQVLGAAAAALGLDASAVEAQLLMFGGNVDAALEALQTGSVSAPPSGAASTAADDSRSTAEPDTPSARLPPWAADAASSAFSAPSPANQSPRAAAAAPAPFGSAVPEPGVLSLADFSSSPGPEAALDALAVTAGAGWPAQAGAREAAPAAANPSAAGFAFPLPTPVSGLSAYDDGYAAGLAAAAALVQQQGMGGQAQPYEQAALPAQAYVPPPQVRPEGDEAEVDALLSLLGIG